MLRIYFKYDRSLLTRLCQCSYRSLLTFFREVVGLKNGVPGVSEKTVSNNTMQVRMRILIGELPDNVFPLHK